MIQPAAARDDFGRAPRTPRGVLARSVSRDLPGLMVAWLLLVLGGCAADSMPPGSVAVMDSAGIRIVHSAGPVWTADAGWRLDSADVRIDAEIGDSVFLFGVRGVVQLSDGEIVLANRGTSQLLFFSESGEYRKSVGRRGKGPGEYDPIQGLFSCAGDTLVVAEMDRLTVLDGEGEVVRMVRVERQAHGGYQSVEGVSADCSSVLVLIRATIAPPFESGPYDQVHTLLWHSLETGDRDTVATFAGPEGAVLDYKDIVFPRMLPWGAKSVWGVAGDRVVLGHGRDFEVVAFDRDRSAEWVARWAGRHRPVTAADRALYGERFEAFTRQDGGVNVGVPPLDHYPAIPRRMPTYHRILVDGEGNVWLEDYPADAAGRPDVFQPETPPAEQRWRVIDAEGRHLGEVRMPGEIHLLGFAGDRAVAIRRDSLDREHVLLFPIHR